MFGRNPRNSYFIVMNSWLNSVIQTRKTWSTITVRKQLSARLATSFILVDTLNTHIWRNVRREVRTELSYDLTSFVPRLSLGLIQYRSTRPMVAYLFCGGRISGKALRPLLTRLTRT